MNVPLFRPFLCYTLSTLLLLLFPERTFCLFSLSPTLVVPLDTWNISSSFFKSGFPVEVSVPSTVLGGLFNSRAPGFDYDPFFGKNLERISYLWFDVPWIYETSVPVILTTRNVDEHVYVLRFEGLNYRADVWVNGIQVGSKKELVGTFRHFEIDVTDAVIGKGLRSCNSAVGDECLTQIRFRVEVWRPEDYIYPPGNNSTDLAISFVNWSPNPPDWSMGLIRPVSLLRLTKNHVVVVEKEVNTSTSDYSACPVLLTFEGAVVHTVFGNERAFADLNVSFVVRNWEKKKITVSVWVDLAIPSIGSFVRHNVVLLSEESARIEFDLIRVQISDSMLWWPWQMGEQKMYVLQAGILTSGPLNSRIGFLESRFGLREMKSQLNNAGYRQYFVNGFPILVRAAGWSPDLFLRSNHTAFSHLRDQFALVRHMNLNAIRMEGKMESDEFYDLADEFGILVLPGWCCCDAWQHWKNWDDRVLLVARESMRVQARRLAIHPSILVFLYSSDELPPADVESVYLQVLKDERWPNPTLASASLRNSSLTGPTGVKMSGPYSWVPPIYWLQDTHRYGGAYGFLTEGGPGESPMTLSSMKRTIPESHLWDSEGSMSDWWSFHCANPGGLFRDLRFFTPPLNARYGAGRSAADYLYKAQAMAYEGIRAMFEAYTRNRHHNATGLVHWMLNNAWPQNIWHLYDSYLAAGGGYYGAKIANEPVHAILSYTDGSVWLSNSLFSPVASEILVTVQIVSLTGQVTWSRNAKVSSLASDAMIEVPGLRVPMDGGGKFHSSDTFLVRLTLEFPGFSGTRSRQTNTYWISAVMDILDWEETNHYRTPCSKYADFTQLQSLNEVILKTSVKKSKHSVEVTVTNPELSTAVAFLIRVAALNVKSSFEVTPSFWTDNYFTLLPAESRSVSTVLPSTVDISDVEVVVDIWNNVVRS